MKSTRVLTALVALTLAIQVVILFNQYRKSSTTGSPPRTFDAKAGTTLDITGLPIKGGLDAKVVLVEFSDYECPFCARHATGAGVEIDRTFVSSGKIKHVFVNNPLPMHSNAELLATGAICAGDQGQYWEMHYALFEHKPPSHDAIIAVAQGLSVDIDKFRVCMTDNPRAQKRIDQDLATAKAFQLTSTPVFALGRIETGNIVAIKKFLRGALPAGDFASEINKMLM